MFDIRPSSLGLGPGVQTYTITSAAGDPVGVAMVDTAGYVDLLLDPRRALAASRHEIESQVRALLAARAA